MNDTTRRFLTAIAERVPAGGRIVELRLFPAIRQGGIESGVAVVAVDSPSLAPDASPAPADGASELGGDASGASSDTHAMDDGTGDVAAAMDTERAVPRDRDRRADDRAAAAAHDLVDTDIEHDEEDGTSEHDAETATPYIPNADTSDDDAVADALDDELTTIVVQTEHAIGLVEARAASARSAGSDRPAVRSAAREPRDAHDDDAPMPDESAHEAQIADDEDSPYADAPPPSDDTHRALLADVAVAASSASDEDADVMQLDDILALPSPDARSDREAPVAPLEESPTPRAIHRYAILTASYRLTLKGPDRGKWDVDMTHEADAPLATVERVARGVAKRSGDGSEPEHFSGDSLQQALDAPAWLETT
jgi:hypothetical protein